MDEAAFLQSLEQILAAIKSLPAGPLQDDLLDQAKKAHRRYEEGQQLVEQVHATVGLLRVHVQYLLFDLEATRRENTTLRKLLEDRNNG